MNFPLFWVLLIMGVKLENHHPVDVDLLALLLNKNNQPV